MPRIFNIWGRKTVEYDPKMHIKQSNMTQNAHKTVKYDPKKAHKTVKYDPKMHQNR